MASIDIEEILALRDDAGNLRAIVVTGIVLNHKAGFEVRIQCNDDTKSVRKTIPISSIDFSKLNPSWTVTFSGDDIRECHCGGIIKALAKIDIIDESGQIVDEISDDKTQHIFCDSLDDKKPPDPDYPIKEFDLCSFFLGLAVSTTLSTIILLIVAGCSINPIEFGIGVATGTATIGFTCCWIYLCKDGYRIRRLLMLSIILMILLAIKSLAFSVISHQCISGSISSIVFMFLIILTLYFAGNLVNCCQLPVITFAYFSDRDKKNIIGLFAVAAIFGVIVGESSINPVFGLIVFLAVFFGSLTVMILNKEYEIF